MIVLIGAVTFQGSFPQLSTPLPTICSLVAAHSVAILKRLTTVSVPKSAPLPCMWVKKKKKMSPLSQIAKLPCLLSASKPAEIFTLSPLSPIKWGFHVCPLKTSHQYLPVCSWILQNVASASILEFWKSASYISSFVFIYQSPQVVLPSVRLPLYRFLSFRIWTLGMGRWRFFSLVHPLQSSSHSHSVYPCFSLAFYQLFTPSKTLLWAYYLLVDRWNGVFSVFIPLNLSAMFV